MCCIYIYICKFTRVAIKLIYAVPTVTYRGYIKNFTVTRAHSDFRKKLGQRTPFFPKSQLEKYVFYLLRYKHVFTVLFVVYWYICYSVLGSVDRSMASSSGRFASTPNNTQTRNQTG